MALSAVYTTLWQDHCNGSLNSPSGLTGWRRLTESCVFLFIPYWGGGGGGVKNHTYVSTSGRWVRAPLERGRKPSGIVFVLSKVQRVSSLSFTQASGIMWGLMWDLNLDLVNRKWQVRLFGMWLSQTPVQAMVLIDNCQLNWRWHVVWCYTRDSVFK